MAFENKKLSKAYLTLVCGITAGLSMLDAGCDINRSHNGEPRRPAVVTSSPAPKINYATSLDDVINRSLKEKKEEIRSLCFNKRDVDIRDAILAEQLYSEAMNLIPDDQEYLHFEVSYSLGVLYETLGNPEKALGYFGRAVSDGERACAEIPSFEECNKVYRRALAGYARSLMSYGETIGDSDIANKGREIFNSILD